MPRRKISVDEAFKVLHDAGIHVQVKHVEPESSAAGTPKPEPVAKPSPYGRTDGFVKEESKTVRVTLYARHSIGCGGVLVKKDGEQTVEHVGVQTYGPGVCTVPREIASSLLYADMKARQTDEQFLSPVQVHRLVVPMRDKSGNTQNVGINVPEEMLDAGNMLTLLPAHMTYVMRG